MLVLSRRLNQTIVIAGRVRVTVLAITPSRVELGVEAPPQVTVDREEIHQRRQEEAVHDAAAEGKGSQSDSRQDAKTPRRIQKMAIRNS